MREVGIVSMRKHRRVSAFYFRVPAEGRRRLTTQLQLRPVPANSQPPHAEVLARQREPRSTHSEPPFSGPPSFCWSCNGGRRRLRKTGCRHVTARSQVYGEEHEADEREGGEKPRQAGRRGTVVRIRDSCGAQIVTCDDQSFHGNLLLRTLRPVPLLGQAAWQSV
jgi:hypothetical protein